MLVDFDGGDLAFAPSDAEPPPDIGTQPLAATGTDGPQFHMVDTEQRRRQAFAAIDALPPVEKVKMFS